MKVVLINPDIGHAERIESQAAWPPLGLLYLGSVLQNGGHEVKVIDNGRTQLPIDRLLKRVKKESPDIVGVGALTPTFKQSIKIASAVKSESPDAKIVFGNYHPTFTYEKILKKYKFVDYVVRGEGEETFLELVEALKSGKKVEKIAGLAYRQGRTVKSSARQPIQDLDKLPIPDRSLLEQEYYSEIMGAIGSGGRFTTILTSRGCPYKCRYCACAAFSYRKIRFRSPESVVSEMEKLQNDGYEEIGIVDDNFFVNKKWMDRILGLIKEKDIKLKFWAEGRVDNASREMLKKFADAGCKIIYFGMESGSQKVLDYFNKNTTPEMNRKAVMNSKAAGIENVIGSFIVGAPVETRADVKQTLDFVMGLDGMDFPQINPLCISPGMELWDDALKGGYMKEDDMWEEEHVALNVFPSHVTEAEVMVMIKEFYSDFVMRPSFLVQQLLKTLKSEYRLRILLKNMGSGTSLRGTLKQFTQRYGEPSP